MGENQEGQNSAMGGVKNALSNFMGMFGKKTENKIEETAKAAEPAPPEPKPVAAIHHHPMQPEAKEPDTATSHQPPAQSEAVKTVATAEVTPGSPEVKSEATHPTPEVKNKGDKGKAVTPPSSPVVPREDFDGRMKMLVERLYEDESLRSDLTDDEAGPLLDWAMNDLMERLEKVYQTATTTKELEEGLESQYAQTRSLIMVKKSKDSPAN